jgi:hypothetical protein
VKAAAGTKITMAHMAKNMIFFNWINQVRLPDNSQTKEAKGNRVSIKKPICQLWHEIKMCFYVS